METKIDKTKLLDLVKADESINNLVERLKAELPSYLKGYVGEECLVNLYLGLPNKSVDVFLFEVDELNVEDKELLDKLTGKYKINQREYIAKRYANRILDSITRVVGTEINWESKIRGDVNGVKPTVILHWMWKPVMELVLPTGYETKSAEGAVLDILTKYHGMLDCESIYVDTDYNVVGAALDNFVIGNQGLLDAKRVNCKQIFTYYAKGLALDKPSLDTLASQWHKTNSLYHLALAKSLGFVNTNDVAVFMDREQFKPVDIAEFIKLSKTKFAF